MNAGKIFRIWMSLIGILFCAAEGKSENSLIFEAEKIVAAGKAQRSISCSSMSFRQIVGRSDAWSPEGFD